MRSTIVFVIGMIVVAPVWAQAPAPSGVLQPPKTASAAPPSPAANGAPTRAVPRARVQQVAPFSSAPLTPAPRAGASPGTLAPRAGASPGTLAPRAGASLGSAAPRPPVVQAPRRASKARPGKAAAAAAGVAAVGAAAGAAAVVAAPPPSEPPAPAPDRPDPAKGTATGQKLPRWAALRTDEVNLRTGPGTRYPVEWVYRRRDLPVQIEREFEVWRLVEDPEGVKGWVHQATLTGRRSFVVRSKDQTLRRSAADDANPVALLRAGVVGRIRACDAAASWCEVQAGDYRGWLKRDALWGLDPGEAVAN